MEFRRERKADASLWREERREEEEEKEVRNGEWTDAAPGEDEDERWEKYFVLWRRTSPCFRLCLLFAYF